MIDKLPGNPHYTGTGPDGREWLDGIPLASDAEVMQARMTQDKIERHVADKMKANLEWRKKFNIVLEHPDDGWVYRPWAAYPQYTFSFCGKKKFGMKAGKGPTCYWPQFEQYGLIRPSYPTLFSETLGYGDRICLGHWGTERFMKIVAVIDGRGFDDEIVSCKENPVRWKIPKVDPLHPYTPVVYTIVFEPDPDHPFYFKEIENFDLEKDAGSQFVETNHPTDKPFPWPKQEVRDTDPMPHGCGCVVMVILILLLMGLISAIFC